jgi:hypothetical protein
MRLLELEILRRLLKRSEFQQISDIGTILKLDVSQMYGIEIEEWPARIAEVAMWLMDHQMNQVLSQEFGEYFVRLPLRSSPHIHHRNALRVDWNEILPAAQCTHVLGNPPFVGKHLLSASQKEDIEMIAGDIPGSGVLDYVTCWYFKAAGYTAEKPTIPIAFVSTNSISQGEQVGVLWNALFSRGAKIHFGHRTFAWTSEARGMAHVHVVIIGWGLFDRPGKQIYDYESDPRNPAVVSVTNISPYLIEGSDLALLSRSEPISDVPPCIYGSKPTDGGNLIIENDDLEEFLEPNTAARRFIRPLLCTQEYLTRFLAGACG